MTDLPFMAPPDDVVTLDLPMPPSVNKLRKIDRNGRDAMRAWRQEADVMVLLQRGARKKIAGQFALEITLGDDCRIDIDNAIKSIPDYLKRIEVISDDSPKFMRRVVVEYVPGAQGCRVRVRGICP